MQTGGDRASHQGESSLFVYIPTPFYQQRSLRRKYCRQQSRRHTQCSVDAHDYGEAIEKNKQQFPLLINDVKDRFDTQHVLIHALLNSGFNEFGRDGHAAYGRCRYRVL